MIPPPGTKVPLGVNDFHKLSPKIVPVFARLSKSGDYLVRDEFACMVQSALQMLQEARCWDSKAHGRWRGIENERNRFQT